MSRKRAPRFSWQHFLPIAVLGLVLVMVYVFGLPLRPQTIHAATANNYAWSGNVGWISFTSQNANPAGACNNTSIANYCVKELAGGALSGYAWSSNIGWISFNAADVSGCPTPASGSCAPRVDLGTTDSQGNHPVLGWARACGSFDNLNACSGTQNLSGGWQGWIHLSGTNYGVAQVAGSCALSPGSWAWGGGIAADNSDANIGWIHFANPPNYQAAFTDGGSGCSAAASPTITLTATPTNISYPGSANDVTLTLTTANVASCTQITGGDSPITLNGATDYNTTVNKSGTVTNPRTDGSTWPATFSITCTGTDATQRTSTAAVTVQGKPVSNPVISSFTANPSIVQTGGVSTLSWTTQGMQSGSCTITANPVSSHFNPYQVPAGNEAIGSAGTDPIGGSAVFTLTCTGTDNNRYSRQTTVTVQSVIEF